jgi:sec-independent protein translocase protein TatA
MIVLFIALIVLGPKKLPEAGKSLGRGMREFKDSLAGISGGDDDDYADNGLPAPKEETKVTAASSTSSAASSASDAEQS